MWDKENYASLHIDYTDAQHAQFMDLMGKFR
jgi:hypothetical protein